MTEEVEPLPLSALNHLLFCERRCALIQVEGVFVENAFTLQGSLPHETADTPGYETRSGVRVVRALPLYSRISAFRVGPISWSSRAAGRPGGRATPCPVDYKRGARRRWDNDDVQLCAQALCLEEMLKVDVPRGAIFHAASKRRRDVDFTSELRDGTIEAARRLHELVRQGRVPAAVLMPRCEGCSLKDICMPELTQRAGIVRSASHNLFDHD